MGGCWCGGDAKRERVAARRDGSVFGKVIRSNNSLYICTRSSKASLGEARGSVAGVAMSLTPHALGVHHLLVRPRLSLLLSLRYVSPHVRLPETSAHQVNNPRNDPIVGSGSARWCAPCWTTPRGDVWTPASTSRTSGTPPSVGRTRWSSTTWTLAPTTR